MNHRCCLPSLLVVLLVAFGSDVHSQDWPAFLGPDGSAKAAGPVPVQWSETENLLWKLPLPGPGSSSPIVVGDRVFVTCYLESDKQFSRFVICVDKTSGDQVWSREFPVEYLEDDYSGYLKEHGYASNTPASDGERLYAFFGKGGVYAMDLDGNVLWNTLVGEMSSNRRWGSAASLLLYGELVIVNAAEESRSIVALNRQTGKEVWRYKSPVLELAYGTPRAISHSGEATEIVFSAPTKTWAMDPDSGKEVWSVSNPMTGNISPSVIVDGSTIYSFGGYRSAGSLSIQTGRTDSGSQARINWTSRTSSYVATPLLHEGNFYWIDDRGLANSSRASDGSEVYRQRVKGLTGRPVYASPILIGDKIYAVTRRAGTIVYQPGSSYSEITRNRIAGDDTDFNASPAVSDNRLYLRSNQALYCIGRP